MTLVKHDYNSHTQTLHDNCKRYMYHHVTLTMTDGSVFDGIIENVDTDRITALVGEDVMEREGENESDTRQYFGYGYPRRRFRRFRRRDFPFAALAALALLPYFAPYPYYPYPYYPYPYY